MLISSTREHNSQGGREYRKGKQERKVTPGNRIKGTDFNSQLNDRLWKRPLFMRIVAVLKDILPQ